MEFPGSSGRFPVPRAERRANQLPSILHETLGIHHRHTVGHLYRGSESRESFIRGQKRPVGDVDRRTTFQTTHDQAHGIDRG